MKPLILCTIIATLLSLTGSKLHAQHPYIPIPEDSAFWISVEKDRDEANHGLMADTSYMVNYTDGKDTIVNGKRYFGYYGQIPPEHLYGTLSMAQETWFRQDTIAKKVWSESGKPGPYEYLLYDFSLQKGDTISDSTSRWFLPPHRFWVADLDSIYFPDGTWRNRWFIETVDPMVSDTFRVVQIEGMGYTTDFSKNPLLVYSGFGLSYQITCFRHNDLWLYTASNPWNADCDSMMDHNVADVGVHTPSANELNLPLLYPNPATSGGMINLNSFAGRTWELHTVTAYNSFGRLVLKKQLKPGRSFALPYLSPGIYFFTVKNSRQKIICKQKISIR